MLKREQPVWVWVAWTVSMVDVFYTVAALLVLVYILSAVLTVSSMAQDADVVQLMLFYVGRPSALSPQAQTVVLQVLPREIFFFRIGYVLVVALVAFGLISRKRIFHILFVAIVASSVVAAYLDFNVNRTITVGIRLAPSTLLQRILQVAVFEALGVYAQITGALAVLLTLLKGGLVFLLEDDFDVVTERLWSVIDRTVREPTTAFVRAKAYMKRGMWTLAAMYLRRSVSLQPDVVDYQLALAESYAHLGRYQRSLEILDQVERLQPNSPIAYHLRDVIVALQSRNAMRDTRKETGER